MSSRIGRTMLDMLDSMANGALWGPTDLRAEIGAQYNLADKLQAMEARGFVELTEEYRGHTTWRWYRITELGRDVLAQEIAAGRIPGVN